MSYLGNLNPYMTQSNYAEEMRKRNKLLTGPKPAPQMSMNPSQAQMSPNREATDTEKYAALLRQAYKDNTAEENALEYQRDSARRLLATKDAGPRQLGNVVVNNPWEGLSVGISRGVGGYMMGKAAEKDEAMQAERDSQQEALISIKAGDREYDRKRDALSDQIALLGALPEDKPGGSKEERYIDMAVNPYDYPRAEVAIALQVLQQPSISFNENGEKVSTPGIDLSGGLYSDAFKYANAEAEESSGEILTAEQQVQSNLADQLLQPDILTLWNETPSTWSVIKETALEKFGMENVGGLVLDEGRLSNIGREKAITSMLGKIISGATVTPQDIKNIKGMVIPVLGDTSEILTQKKARYMSLAKAFQSGVEGAVDEVAMELIANIDPPILDIDDLPN